MHLLLTDRLACPRCGPEFGLILLGERIEERRVLEGVLGCANCREQYPVRGGFADFRPPPREPFGAVGGIRAEPGSEDPNRVAALLGLADGGGNVLLLGTAVPLALSLAGLLEEVEVVAADPDLRAEVETPGVSRIACGPRLPFFSGMFRGVCLGGEEGLERLDEALRMVARGGRLLLLDGGDDRAVERVESGGLGVLVREKGVLVAARK